MKFNNHISKKPGKQRKAAYDAPLHARANKLNCNLSKDLRAKKKKRTLRLTKGDTVRVVRGRFKKRTGTVTSVDLKKCAVFVKGVVYKKQNGKEVQASLQPSNLIMTAFGSNKKEEKPLNKPEEAKKAEEKKQEEK